MCGTSSAYITALDRYGDVLNQTAPTVGDVTDAGTDLTDPREETVKAGEAAVSAQQDLASAEQDLADAQAVRREPVPLRARTSRLLVLRRRPRDS